MTKEIKYEKIGTSQTSHVDNKKRKEVKVKVPKTENIIFVGSELSYNSFWLKMMFIVSAYLMATKSENFRKADKKTIAYVDEGYTHLEKLPLEMLKSKHGFEIVPLRNPSDFFSCMNKSRDVYKLQDVVFFSHGVVGKIKLDYKGDEEINLDLGNYAKIDKSAFAVHGRIFSYACRTGVSVDDHELGFENEAEAMPEQSLAQKMANHFGVEVHAFLKRTFYGSVIREKSQSNTIASFVKEERKTKEGQVIQIPPAHEALPHDGLGDSWIPFSGPKKEGTDNYALWRKEGGLRLPSSADSPKGLPDGMRVFRPQAENKPKIKPKTKP